MTMRFLIEIFDLEYPGVIKKKFALNFGSTYEAINWVEFILTEHEGYSITEI